MGNYLPNLNRGPYTQGDVTETIKKLRMHLTESLSSVAHLKQIESETGQGQSERSDPPNRNLRIILERIEEKLKSSLTDLDTYERIKADVKRHDKTYVEGQSVKSRKVAIQLYCAQKTDLTNDVIHELETKMNSKLFQQRTTFNVQTCETPASIKSSIPLLIICLGSSRLGIDFNDAVHGVQTGSNTAVLIFHHLKPHVLPTQPSSTILTGAEFRNLGTIIDVAFFEGMGLYDCDMNKNAYKTILSFIDEHCQK